jgi:hypothetical protein
VLVDLGDQHAMRMRNIVICPVVQNLSAIFHKLLGSVVGIATAYGLDGPRIESRWGRDFPYLSRPALMPTQPPVQWVPRLPQG